MKIGNLEIKNNVFLVWDKNDDVTPYWICKKLEKGLINSSIFIFNYGKHFAYLYNINKFVEIIKIALR